MHDPVSITLERAAVRMLRDEPLTEAEHNELRKVAIDKGVSTAQLVGKALRESRHTRAAFQTKDEDGKR